MKKNVILIFLILALTGNAIFWADQKEGFHVDEMFSYEQVGNTEYPKPEYDRPDEPCLNTWHSRSYYEDYLTVNSDEAFDVNAFYRSACRNTAHPPLYLTLFGILISAFFRDHFTKWSGIAFNFIFYILTLAAVYKLSKQILKKEIPVLISVTMCGICVAMISTVVFIRDYMMLTFFSVAILNMHIKLLRKEAVANKAFRNRVIYDLYLVLLLELGALTHYYFIIFAFCVCLGFSLILIFTGERRFLFEYILSCAISALIYYLLWPNVIRDLSTGQRGTEAIRNLTGLSSDYGVQLANFLHEIDIRLFAGKGILLAAVVLLGIIGRILKQYSPVLILKNSNEMELRYTPRSGGMEHETNGLKRMGMEWLLAVFVFFAAVSYLLVITKVAPVLWLDVYKDPRYIYNIFPCLIIIIIFFLDKFLLHFCNSPIWRTAVWTVLVSLMILSYGTCGVDYLYRGADAQLKQLEEYADCRSLFISEMEYLCSNLNVYFTKCEAVYQTNSKGLSRLPEIREEIADSEVLVYISNDTEIMDEVLSTVYQKLGAKECEYLFETVGRHTAMVFLMKL